MFLGEERMGGSSLGCISSARAHLADPEPPAPHSGSQEPELSSEQARSFTLTPRVDAPWGRLRSGIAIAAGGVRVTRRSQGTAGI